MTMPMAASRPPAPLISLHASKKRFSLFEMERSNFFSISSSLYLPLPMLSISLDVFQPLPTSQLLLPPKALAPSSLLIYLLLLTLNLLVDVVVAVVDNASLFHFSSSRYCQETDFPRLLLHQSAKGSFSAMTRRKNRSRPADVPADSSQDPEQSGDRDGSAVGQPGLGGGGAVDEAAGPPASPAAASSGRQDGEEMDDSGFEEPPRKLWRGERPGEQEDFVYLYQRCRMDDPSVSPRMRHQTAQNEMNPEATNRAAEAAAGPDCRRSGVDPDYEGPEEFEWEGANKRLGGSGMVHVLDITRSRRMQELRAARGAKPVWRRPRSRKSADAPTQEAAGRPAPPPKKKKASRGASATAAAAQRQPASSMRPPMPPPPRTSFSVRRIARPEGESPPPSGAPLPTLPTLRITSRPPTPTAGSTLLLPRGGGGLGRMPLPPPGYRYQLVPIGSAPNRPQQQPQPLRAPPPRSSSSVARPLMPPPRQPLNRQAHQFQRLPRQEAPRQKPNQAPAAGRGGHAPRGQRSVPAAAVAHTKTRPATTKTTKTTTTATNTTTPSQVTDGNTTTSETAPPAARGAAANGRGARRSTSGGNPPQDSAPPKEQRPPTQGRGGGRGRGARGRGAKGGAKRDWRKEREEWNAGLLREFPDHVVQQRRGENYKEVTIAEPLRQQGEANDLAARKEELRVGLHALLDEVMRTEAVAAEAQDSSTSAAAALSLPAATPAEEPAGEEEWPQFLLPGDWGEGEGVDVEEEATEEESSWAAQTLPKSVVEEGPYELQLHVDDSERRSVEVDDEAGPSGFQDPRVSTRYEQKAGDEEEEEEDEDDFPLDRRRVVENRLSSSRIQAALDRQPGGRDPQPHWPDRYSNDREHLEYALRHFAGAIDKHKKKRMVKQLEMMDARDRMRRERGDPDSEGELDQEQLREAGRAQRGADRGRRGGGGGGRKGKGKGKGRGR